MDQMVNSIKPLPLSYACRLMQVAQSIIKSTNICKAANVLKFLKVKKIQCSLLTYLFVPL